MDDVTLARKVESIVFRPEGAPRGSVDVNVADGVVYLHGQVKRPEQIKALEKAVLDVPEVKDVENLLHLPKTPAKSRT
jgi:osmotically-inducible protein OsmY